MKITSSTLTSADVLPLIEEARDAELCRNFDLFREILSSFWEDIESEPEITLFVPTIQAELLRLCGVYLSHFGRARGLTDYQLRAKNILTRAIELFEIHRCSEKAAETKVALANCYWFSGEISEYDDLIRIVEEEFLVEPRNPVSIQIKLNRLLVANWRRDKKEAQHLIGEITGVISAKHDFRLRTQFHNLAGIACRVSGDLVHAALHANEAVKIARETGNHIFLAMSLNNLAFVYRIAGHLDQALATSNEAIAITVAGGDKGWTAHFLDTKALIYLDECEYEKALAVIEKSVEIFSQGEDYGGLTDAMWTKCLCLLRLNQVREATVLFADLTEIASRQIGEVAVDKFEKLLTEEVHILKHFPLADELAALKRSLVVNAMRESDNHVSKAARRLGLRSQQHLSDILNNQFPDIYEELGIKRRVRRTNQTKQKQPAPDLARLVMPKNRTYSFNFAWSGNEELQFFYFPRNLMREFGLKTAAIVAVMAAKSEPLFDGGVVLYFNNDTFRIGRLSYDEFTELFLVDLEEPTFLSDVELIGVPIGYCPVSEQNKRTMKFEQLRLVKK
jgi:tetratricopeptide (TPR) repeat protein